MTHHEGTGSDVPQTLKDYLATLTPQERETLKKIKDKVDTLTTDDSVKAQVV
ncbi:MAG TPA: hypothetical protein VF972_07580 [Actinomycetota bacterium]